MRVKCVVLSVNFTWIVYLTNKSFWWCCSSWKLHTTSLSINGRNWKQLCQMQSAHITSPDANLNKSLAVFSSLCKKVPSTANLGLNATAPFFKCFITVINQLPILSSFKCMNINRQGGENATFSESLPSTSRPVEETCTAPWCVASVSTRATLINNSTKKSD